MGRRDYRHREPKKQKKDAKKTAPVNIIQSPVQVEVVKKGKKKREEVEEEEG
jgi:hypothetical protein